MVLLFLWSCFLAGLKVVDISDSDKWGSCCCFAQGLLSPVVLPGSLQPWPISDTRLCWDTAFWPLQPCRPASTSLAVAAS